MRLFIGLAFDSPTKDAVYHLSRQIHPLCEGHFTEKENLHLTLKFLGEVQGSLLPVLRSGLQTAVKGQPAFRLTTARLGSFRGKNGEKTLWLGTEDNAELRSLFHNLEQSLVSSGFAPETRPLRAHITLARRAVCEDELFPSVAISPFTIPVNGVTLFESVRVNGELIYKPLFTASLKKPAG
jgi:2'-5' RNA ligase